MKLTIFYDKRNIEFLLEFSSISEEYFIESSGHAVQPEWEMGKDNGFYEQLSSASNLLIVLSKESINCKWIAFALGYAKGKNINCHFFTVDSVIPDWFDVYSISKSIEDLVEYYKYYNEKWFEEATVRIAKKSLVDLQLDITLTAFVEVVKDGDCLLAGIYLDAGYNATDTDKNGVPLICWAARKRRLPMMQLLMQAGADINAVSGDRNDTALIDGVSEDDFEIVTFILDYKPNLEIQSKNGQTALIVASGHNNLEIVKLLIEAGAETSSKDKLGMSALAYAKLQQNQEIIALLTNDEE